MNGELPVLQLTAGGVTALADRIASIDLTGEGPPAVPWGTTVSQEALASAIDSGAPAMPLVYHDAYIAPLQQNLARIVAATPEGSTDPAETLTGAVYDHAPGSEVAAPLRRFLAVVGDLYESFLADAKRRRLGISLSEQLPPLAMFRHDGSLGPYTYPVDAVYAMLGAEVGVVSVPSTYRHHPLLWGALAHETGGHDVIHADAGLLEEMQNVVASLFATYASTFGGTDTANLVSALWQHWMDEAAADVYGTLNLGPAFALSFTPWLMGFRYRLGQTPVPALLTNSIAGSDGAIDVHPPDLLRLDLASGVLLSLRELQPLTRYAYWQLLQELDAMSAGDTQTVTVRGNLAQQGGGTMPIDAAVPLWVMRASAAMVGSVLTTYPMQALAGRSIQDLETWSDADEAAAQRICIRALNGQSIDAMGDVAQVISGTTMAAVIAPERYDAITATLAAGLDAAVAADALWAGAGVRLTHVAALLSAGDARATEG
ncbi:MAG TPA: hypothetical protein VND45_01460 [Thermoanaerobaculia bacterium]|nr:hypothetical protein [Thermoanaerobaculia bacterium]